MKIIFCISLLFLIYSADSNAKIDKSTWCENNTNEQKKQHLAVLYDRTERYDPELIVNIKAALLEEKEKLEDGTLVSFFSFDKTNGFHASAYIDTFCVIGKPSKFLSNRFLVKAQKKKEDKRISDFIETQNPSTGTNGSPIADAIISLSRSQQLSTTTSDLKIIIISDLVENSEAVRLNNTKLSNTDASRFSEILSEGKRLPLKTSFIVFYVQRKNYSIVQGGDSLELMWRKFFKNIGTHSDVVFKKVQ